MKKKGIAIFCLLFLLLTGCSENMQNTRVVLTTGFTKNEVFRIENVSCTLPEAMVFLVNMRNRYETVYGGEVWDLKTEETELEESVKDMTLAQLSQLKAMNLLAGQYGITLDEEEVERAKTAAQEYFSSLNETEKRVMNVEEKTIRELYLEYALSQKVYQYIIKDINPEISDDEARTITVQYIFFQTSVKDGTGKKIDYSEEEKEEVLEAAQKVLALTREEEVDFEKLLAEYSDDTEGTISFGKGEMEQAFENAAFNLATGEISDIVETSMGYYIIRCISTFNREETDANKMKIVKQRREEVFGEEYETFVKGLTRNLNTELWDKVELPQEEELATTSFLDVFEKYFAL